MSENKRSRFQIFREDVLGIRIKPNTTGDNSIPITRPGHSLVDLLDMDKDSVINISDLNDFRTLSDLREYQYRVYDEMVKDSVIASAIEMYADDATQYNRDGSIIWVDAEDKDIAAFGNRLIDILKLDQNAWSHIYSLCLYGDLYLETFMDTEKESEKLQRNDGFTDIRKIMKGSVMEESIEVVPNPCEMFDLVERGKTVGFLRVPVEDQSELRAAGIQSLYNISTTNNSTVIYDPRKFVHISLSQNISRFPEKMTISVKNNKDEIVNKVYNIKRGKSILHDIYKIYQEVKLMEDSILLNRITRSSIIRLLQVEVGDMTKSQVSNLLKRLKQMMEQRNMLDKDGDRFKSQAAPGPIDNIIYIPTRNGKGTVSMSNVGGDVDIKSIADLDYYSNKLFGGLKIPKQYFGFMDDAVGFSGGTSLTKLDSRYARTIKRIQNAYIQGITNLINLFALDKNLDSYVNNFTVKMVSPATTEDAERDESMANRLDLIRVFMELLGDSYSDETKKEVFEYFVNIYLSDNGLSEILKADEDINEEETMNEEEGDEFDMDFEFSPNIRGGGPSEPNIPTEGSTEEEFPEFTPNEELGTAEEEFGSFEDEF